jgi:2-polyprenyl-6-methoxyphenol hydroxylase-like FAD-dependent oxidoreductase
MKVAIAGGGIGGLALALSLHARGIDCDVFEAAPEMRELGVGITLLPHAMRELAALGLQAEIEALGIENRESVFANRWGQIVYREPRGRHAGYALPEIGIHRGRLHGAMWRAVLARLGPARVHLDRRAVDVSQDAAGATLHLAGSGPDAPLEAVRADVVVACDGVGSAIRARLRPQDTLAFAGINTWRGVTRRPPILDGKTYFRIGTIDTGKMVIYPIVDDVDANGLQLVNWVAELRDPQARMNDWNRPARLESFAPVFADWSFDWLDVPALIRDADRVIEYPMVDRDPADRWTYGRVTLLGDAAHPMYPRGSNGSAQALIDARVLAEQLALAGPGDACGALEAYEAQRRPATSRIVETNRSVPPDYILMKVDALTDGRPFERLSDVISEDELRRISDDYKRIAGFSVESVKVAGG